MAVANPEKAKRIEELTETKSASKDTTYLLVSDKNLTRKISLGSLRASFVGDSATSGLDNVFYSASKVNALLEALSERIAQIDDKLNALSETLTSSVNTISNTSVDMDSNISALEVELQKANETIKNSVGLK